MLVPEQLYIRTTHPSLSSDPRVARRDIRAVIRKHEETIRAAGCWAETMAAYHTDLGRKFIEARERDEAHHHLRKAASLQPTTRRLALLAFTVLPWVVFSIALRAKRADETRRHRRPAVDDLSQSVPGLSPTAE